MTQAKSRRPLAHVRRSLVWGNWPNYNGRRLHLRCCQTICEVTDLLFKAVDGLLFGDQVLQRLQFPIDLLDRLTQVGGARVRRSGRRWRCLLGGVVAADDERL